MLERNTDHVQQAKSSETPFASGPLSELFGLYGTNSNADVVLRGDLAIEDLPVFEVNMEWLEEMVYNDVPIMSTYINITPKQFK